MAKGKRRPLRVLGLLLLALLVLLLLEMNRFFPGVWPGGGGDAGLRPKPSGEARDPERVVPSVTPLPPPEPAEGAIRVVVQGPGGTPLRGGEVVLAGGGPRAALADGTALVSGVAEAPSGFAVTDASGARLLHGPPPKGRAWVVQWPATPLPTTVAPAGTRTLVVTDAAGAPAPSAKVEVTQAGGRETSLETDAEGKASLPADAGVVRVCVTAAEGSLQACLYASTAAPGPLEVRLPALATVGTSFADPDTGEPLVATALRLVEEGGEKIPLPPPDGGWKRYDDRLPADVAARRSLEIEVDGRPPLRIAFASLGATTKMPKGRRLEAVVSDAEGKPVPGARVTAHWSPQPVAEAAEGTVESSRLSDAEGRAALAVPDDRPADVLVEADGLAPVGFRLPPATSLVRRDVSLARGVSVPVVVRGEGGKPVAGAEVIVLAAAGSGTTHRAATTDADGRAAAPPVAEGRVEVFAHAPGYAWASVTARASRRMEAVTLSLERGAPLRLVVEDPWGVPLAGVRVHSQPRAEADAGVPAASPPDEKPWVTNDDGILLVPEAPDRPLDLHLSKPGFRDEVVPRVRPGPATWFATLVPAK